MDMKRPFLAMTMLLASGTAWAQQNPPAGNFQICLFPNPCGSGVKPAPSPKPEPEKPAPVQVDPLTDAILQGTLTQGDGGVVSSIRLKPEQTGVAHDQIVTRGTGLRDALAPLPKRPGLPASAVPAKRDGAKEAAQDEWVTVDSTNPAAAQLNGMRAERKALQSGGESSHAAASRQWKGKK